MDPQRWMVYDPGWLVDLAREQLPEEPWLTEALSKCTRCLVVSEYYVRLDDERCQGVSAQEQEFETSMILEHPRRGYIALDISRKNRVVGLEFLSKI